MANRRSRCGHPVKRVFNIAATGSTRCRWQLVMTVGDKELFSAKNNQCSI
jgi:hypothetical protein